MLTSRTRFARAATVTLIGARNPDDANDTLGRLVLQDAFLIGFILGQDKAVHTNVHLPDMAT